MQESQFDTGKFSRDQIGYARGVRALASGVSIPQGEAPISPRRNSQSWQNLSGWEGRLVSLGVPCTIRKCTVGR